MNKIKVGSLFSGIGGIEIGFEEAGFETAWFIESDPYAQAILRKRFPKANIYGDAEKTDFRTIQKVSIISFGFPCQDISNAGGGAGIKGSRSSLWKCGFKAIRQILPEIAFIENVSALIGRGLDVVLADLASIGYDAEWHCVSASAVGANHRRDRIWIIAYSNRFRFNNGQNLVREMEYQNTEEWKIEKKLQRERWRILRSIKNDKMAMQQVAKSLDIEPLLSRDDDGFSQAVDRIRCLGNAVVPQVAEVFAKAIKEVICT